MILIHMLTHTLLWQNNSGHFKFNTDLSTEKFLDSRKLELSISWSLVMVPCTSSYLESPVLRIYEKFKFFEIWNEYNEIHLQLLCSLPALARRHIGITIHPLVSSASQKICYIFLGNHRGQLPDIWHVHFLFDPTLSKS